jgi:PAS domain S-box-containing protein
MNPGPHSPTLARGVAQGARPAELLTEIHRNILLTAGATASIVLQRVTRSGDYVAPSGAGIVDLEGIRLRGAEARTVDAFAGDTAVTRTLEDVPTLRARLGTAVAITVGIAGTSRPSCLVVCAPGGATPELVATLGRARIELGLAHELDRHAREAGFHSQLRELFLGFSQRLADLTVDAALAVLALDANRLFGARRTSVWLHDRRARHLTLSASSDPASLDHAARVSTADPAAPAARGLRLERPHILVSPDEQVVIAPLRGWRRALGTLVIEGQLCEFDDEQLVAFAHELARQLAAGVENVQLIQEILRQRRLLENAFDSLIDLVVVTDTNLRVVQMNEAFETRAAAPRASLLDRPLADLVGADMAAWVAEVHAERATPEEMEMARSRQFDDERLAGVFAATVTPLINQHRRPVGHVLVARDITAQTRLERERAALRERLAQSEKLASLGQFVAGIAHEMNNPLQGVLGHLELMIQTSAQARPFRSQLKRIYNDADRTAKIVRNLLVFAGSRRMARRRIGVDRVLTRALSNRSAARRAAGIDVVRRQASALPPVLGDPLLLQQAFLNILINAEHAVNAARTSGGLVEIDTRIDDRRHVVITTIRDNGAGIAADVLPRIFDPFFSTKEVGAGTGLGLAITYGIIQEHGGTIEASNAPDGGAAFRIELPATGW